MKSRVQTPSIKKQYEFLLQPNMRASVISAKCAYGYERHVLFTGVYGGIILWSVLQLRCDVKFAQVIYKTDNFP